MIVLKNVAWGIFSKQNGLEINTHIHLRLATGTFAFWKEVAVFLSK